MFLEEEIFFQCPYCGENISMLLDPSAGPQKYVEDCEVCCRPITIDFQIGPDGIQLRGAYRTQG